METRIIHKKNLGQFTAVASLPDMGRVGGIVSSYLALSLQAKLVAEFTSTDKPWVNYSDGVVSVARDIYRLYCHEGDAGNFLIFTGESQPQDPTELHKLCNSLLDTLQSMGDIRRIYSAGGYLREQLTGAPRVCGVVNKSELQSVLTSAGIETIGNEIKTITWFNGLIMGLAAERNIDGIGLFGEISETSVPQPLAAKSILSAFSKLEMIPIDTKPLDQQYESLLDDIQKKKEPSKFGHDS